MLRARPNGDLNPLTLLSTLAQGARLGCFGGSGLRGEMLRSVGGVRECQGRPASWSCRCAGLSRPGVGCNAVVRGSAASYSPALGKKLSAARAVQQCATWAPRRQSYRGASGSLSPASGLEQRSRCGRQRCSQSAAQGQCPWATPAIGGREPAMQPKRRARAVPLGYPGHRRQRTSDAAKAPLAPSEPHSGWEPAGY
jgi:hypothetical protein